MKKEVQSKESKEVKSEEEPMNNEKSVSSDEETEESHFTIGGR